MREEIEELILESYENGDITLNEATVLMEAVDPFTIMCLFILGGVTYVVTDFYINKAELAKIGMFYKRTDPKFVPFKQFSTKSYKISKPKFGEYPEIIDKKNADIFSYISGNIGKILYHNENPVMSYIITIKMNGNIQERRIYMKLLDQSFKKYENYYMACIMSKIGAATSEMRNWVRDEYRKIKNIDRTKSFTESEHKSKIIDDFKIKKSDKNIKFISISTKEACKYLLKDSYCKKIIDHITKYQNGEIIVDIDSDKIVGRIFIWNDVDKKNTGFINSLYIDKNYRGYGFGNKLVKDAITKYNGTDLTVYKDNKVAIELYKKHGFVIDESKSDKKTYYMVLKSNM